MSVLKSKIRVAVGWVCCHNCKCEAMGDGDSMLDMIHLVHWSFITCSGINTRYGYSIGIQNTNDYR